MDFIDIIRLNMQIIIILIVTIMFIYVYFFPCYVAYKAKNKRYRNGIIVLNLFLGWTLLGWIGALIWAVTIEKENII